MLYEQSHSYEANNQTKKRPQMLETDDGMQIN